MPVPFTQPLREHPEHVGHDDPGGARVAADGAILLAEVGSGAHGLAIEGTDDHDEMGICVPPIERVLGMDRFEHHVYRSRPEGERSGAGDVDRTFYSAQKFCRLGLSGNPTVLIPLFSPEPIFVTAEGEELRRNAQWFYSRRSVEAFLGYMRRQRERLDGSRARSVSRPELVEAHGFDTKFAMHAIRLGIQGLEFALTGKLTLPLPEPHRSRLISLRTGGVSLDEVVDWADSLEFELRSALDAAPETPAVDAVESWLCRVHLSRWR